MRSFLTQKVANLKYYGGAHATNLVQEPLQCKPHLIKKKTNDIDTQKRFDMCARITISSVHCGHVITSRPNALALVVIRARMLDLL